MSWTRGFSYEEEKAMFADVESAAARAASYQKYATPQLAQQMGRFGMDFPDADAGVSLSVAAAVADGLITQEQGNRAIQESLEIQVQDNIDNFDEDRPWWKKGVDWGYDKFKKNVKWGIAAAEFIPQMVVNLSSRLYAIDNLGERGLERFYEKPTTGFTEGLFSSTDLGALMSGRDSGTGFFIGEAAFDYQQKNVLAYRGGFRTADDTVLPLTLGRVGAGIFYDPDTTGFNTASGVVDLGLAIAIPSAPGAKAAASGTRAVTARGARALGVSETSALTNPIVTARRYAGISVGRTGDIDVNKFDQYLNTNQGSRMADFVAKNIRTLDDAMFHFRGNLPISLLRELSTETNPDKIKEILRRNVGVAGDQGRGAGIARTEQLPTAQRMRNAKIRQNWDHLKPWSDRAAAGDPSLELARQARRLERSNKPPNVIAKEMRRLRAKALRDQDVNLVFDDEIATTESLRNLSAYLTMLRVDPETASRLIDEVAEFADKPSVGSTGRVADRIYTVIEDAVVGTRQIRGGRWSEQANRDAIRAVFKGYDGFQDSVYGSTSIASAGTAQIFDAAEVASSMKLGVASQQPIFRGVDAATGDTLHVTAPPGTAQLASETARNSIALPNAERLRRATGRLAFLFEKGGIVRTETPLGRLLSEQQTNLGQFGELNAPLATIDFLINKVWRQSALMTNGYVLRNLADSTIRPALAPGVDSGIKHPIRHLSLVTRRKHMLMPNPRMTGDITGRAWDAADQESLLNLENARFRDAVGDNARDINPIKLTQVAQSQRVYGRALRPQPGMFFGGDAQKYVQGIGDQLHLLANDQLAVLIARGVEYQDTSGFGQLSKLEWFENAQGMPSPDSIKNWLKFTPEGQKYAQRMDRQWQGMRYREGIDQPSVNIRFLDENGDLIDETWDALVELLSRRINAETLGGDDRLLSVIRGDDFGVPVIGRRVGEDLISEVPAFKQIGNDLTVDGMDYVGYSPEYLDEIATIVKEKYDEGLLDVLPDNVKYRIEMNANSLGDNAFTKVANAAVNRWFGHVFGSKEAKWNRSPFAREQYYRQVESMIGAVRVEDARQIMTNIRRGLYNEFGEMDRILKAAPKQKSVFSRSEYDTLVARYKETIEELQTRKANGFDTDELGNNIDIALRDQRNILSKFESAEVKRVRSGLNYPERLVVNGLDEYRKVPASGFKSLYKRKGVWVTKEQYNKLVAENKAKLDELRNADVYRPEDFQKMLEAAESGQLKSKFGNAVLGDMADYVGSKDMLAKILKRATDDIDAPSADRLGRFYSFDELDFAAKTYSAERTKNLFYDASNRSNFAQIMQVIAPFPTSWYEVIKSYKRMALQSPNSVGFTLRAMSDLRPMEGNQRGRGFLYRDPLNNELMFNVPFDNYLIPALAASAGANVTSAFLPKKPLAAFAGALTAAAVTSINLDQEDEGINPQAVAPVQSLSMGFSVLPGFGPAVQWPAVQLLKDKPGAQDFLDFVAPYGAEEFSVTGAAGQFTPAWVKRMTGAIFGNERSDEQFLQMYNDVYVALSASGRYDLSTNQGRASLQNRARDMTKRMLFVQAIGQFTGPFRPDLNFDVPVEFDDTVAPEDVKNLVQDGYIPNVFLSAAYRGLQDEDFESAPRRFIEIFGENAILYMGSQTRTEAQGLGVSKRFLDFELENSQFRDQNPDVWGYFVDAEDDFSYQAYRRQIETGQRVRIRDADEVIRATQATIGKAFYRDFVRKLGNDQSDYANNLKRQYRETLFEQYPGYATEALNINELNASIRMIEEAAFDESAPDNQVVRGARQYLRRREQIIGQAAQRAAAEGTTLSPTDPLGRAAFRDLRYLLQSYGEELSLKYPAFDRLWSRELLDEVSVDR